MPLPTRANPGLCCKRIKKKHGLQYALKNLQEKDLNFTRNALLHRYIFQAFPRSVQHVCLMVDFKPILDISRHSNML